MTPKQTLLAHLAEHHPRVKRYGNYQDLGRRHGNDHHHFRMRHYHAGVNLGPGQRPAGWRSGQDAVIREEG